ncbi:MAG: hypothetical protein WEA76_04220 [Acidimicrobiia bacterium]
MKGRPVLGVVSGLFFGLFGAVMLQQFSIWPLDTVSLIGLPVVGVILGLVLAKTAPFSKTN